MIPSSIEKLFRICLKIFLEYNSKKSEYCETYLIIHSLKKDKKIRRNLVARIIYQPKESDDQF